MSSPVRVVQIVQAYPAQGPDSDPEFQRRLTELYREGYRVRSHSTLRDMCSPAIIHYFVMQRADKAEDEVEVHHCEDLFPGIPPCITGGKPATSEHPRDQYRPSEMPFGPNENPF